MITAKNRINRRTYLVTSFLVTAAYYAISIPLALLPVDNLLLSLVLNLVGLVLFIAVVYAAVCIFIKRLHDVGLGGVYALLLLVPLAALAFLFIPGQEKKNQYGKSPKPGIDYQALLT